MAAVAKALGDPVRLTLIDVLRRHAGKVCVCELVPLFDLAQPTISHHLKVLRDAGLVGSERQGPVGVLLRHPRPPRGAQRMAAMTNDTPTPEPCCAPGAQADCCAPDEQPSCCGPQQDERACGCRPDEREDTSH